MLILLFCIYHSDIVRLQKFILFVWVYLLPKIIIFSVNYKVWRKSNVNTQCPDWLNEDQSLFFQQLCPSASGITRTVCKWWAWSGGNDFMASLWDAAHKCLHLAWIQPCLFFTDSIRELIHTPWGEFSQATGTQEHVPSIFYHIQVRQSSWPVFFDNSISLLVVFNYLVALLSTTMKVSSGWISTPMNGKMISQNSAAWMAFRSTLQSLVKPSHTVTDQVCCALTTLTQSSLNVCTMPIGAIFGHHLNTNTTFSHLSTRVPLGSEYSTKEDC